MRFAGVRSVIIVAANERPPKPNKLPQQPINGLKSSLQFSDHGEFSCSEKDLTLTCFFPKDTNLSKNQMMVCECLSLHL